MLLNQYHSVNEQFEKLEESLPSRDQIYNSLTKRETSDVDYKHLTSIRKTFRMKNMKDYHNMYLKLDVLL